MADNELREDQKVKIREWAKEQWSNYRAECEDDEDALSYLKEDVFDECDIPGRGEELTSNVSGFLDDVYDQDLKGAE